MPRIGKPCDQMPLSGRGEPASCTLAGPPDKMIAAGSHARIFSSGVVHGRISQYTSSSRTRRAMSCVVCEPKSRMRTRGDDIGRPRNRSVRGCVGPAREWDFERICLLGASLGHGHGHAPGSIDWLLHVAAIEVVDLHVLARLQDEGERQALRLIDEAVA